MTEVTLDHLARSINLRELGGVPAQGGRAVRRGALYRSAALGELTPGEQAALAGLGVRAIIDLRYNSERAAQPTPWAALGCGDYWALDHEPARSGDLSHLLANSTMTREDAHELMVGVYRDLPFRHVEALQRLFRTAAAGEGPMLFHCTSGKDRTGMSAALLLSALGAPREAILADFMASLHFDILASPAFRALAPERQAALAPIYRVHADYLHAMFRAIEAREGSVDAFLSGALGLGDAELTQLRETLLS
jgi:protein-tyrosine phosphatase